jgi:hypothetical protein
VVIKRGLFDKVVVIIKRLHSQPSFHFLEIFPYSLVQVYEVERFNLPRPLPSSFFICDDGILKTLFACVLHH